MKHPKTSIKQLQQELASARQKIAELESALRPFNHSGVMEFTVQNTLREDINSLLSLINSTEDLIWFIDCDKRILLANEAMITTFKETRQSEIKVGMTNHDFLSPDQAEYFDRIFDSVLLGKTLRLNYTAPNDREYSATVQPVKRGAEIIGVSIFARDITQIHELEEDLRIFEQIFTSAPDMIAVIDRDYRCQVINDAFLEAFDIKKKNILGTHYASIVNPGHFKENTEPNLRKAFQVSRVTQPSGTTCLRVASALCLSPTTHCAARSSSQNMLPSMPVTLPSSSRPLMNVNVFLKFPSTCSR